MNNLLTRILSGVLLGSVVLAITYTSAEGFTALCAIGGVILAREWWQLTRHRSLLWIPIGIVYLGTGIASMLLLRSGYYEWRLIFLLCALVWSGDTAAYLIGKRFGRHKIAPHISPGKSWEGLAGSIFATTAVWVLALTPKGIAGYVLMLLLGCLFAFTGLAGDLFESSLKRHAGVKDSGRLIPGHGGLFDRVDALLPCAMLLAGFWVIISTSIP